MYRLDGWLVRCSRVAPRSNPACPLHCHPVPAPHRASPLQHVPKHVPHTGLHSQNRGVLANVQCKGILVSYRSIFKRWPAKPVRRILRHVTSIIHPGRVCQRSAVPGATLSLVLCFLANPVSMFLCWLRPGVGIIIIVTAVFMSHYAVRRLQPVVWSEAV